MLKGKIHRATVTRADLNYIGSITLDENLMDAAGFIEYEKVQVLDITNGNRIDTYIIRGKKYSNEVFSRLCFFFVADGKYWSNIFWRKTMAPVLPRSLQGEI